MKEDVFEGMHKGERQLIKLISDAKNAGVTEVTLQRLPDAPRLPIPLGNRCVNLQDRDSFVRYVSAYGDPDKSVVLCDINNGLVLFIEDYSIRQNYEGQYDQAILDFTFSGVFNTFQNIVNVVDWRFSHKKLLQMFKLQQRYILDLPKLVESWEALETTAGLKVDSKFSDKDGRAIGVSWQSKTDSKKHPGKLITAFTVSCPILEGDETAEDYEIYIDINEPENSEDAVYFTLRSDEIIEIKKERVATEFGKIKTGLGAFRVFNGEF